MLKMNSNIYYANIGLMYCANCGGEAIISIERKESTGFESLICPYCGRRTTTIKLATTDDTRGNYELDSFTLVEKIEEENMKPSSFNESN